MNDPQKPPTPNPDQGIEVEVAHEALIRNWDRLRGWVSEDFVGLRLRQEVSEAAKAWRDNGREASFLELRRGRLAEIEAMRRVGRLPLNPLESEFYRACIAERDREIEETQAAQTRELEAAREVATAQEKLRKEAEERVTEQRRAGRRLRQYLVVALAFLVVAAGTSVFAIDKRGEALDSKAKADANAEQAQTALAQGLLAQSDLAVRSGDDELAAFLAMEAYNRAPEGTIDGSVGTALDASIGAPTFSWLLDDQSQSAVTTLAFQPQGSLLAASHGADEITLWNFGVAPPFSQVLDEPTSSVTSVAFSLDGRWLAAGTSPGLIDIWDVSSGSPQYWTSLQGPPRGRNGLAFGRSESEGEFLVAAGCSHPVCSSGTFSIQQWTAPFDVVEPTSVELPGDRVYSLSVSSDGHQIAAGGCLDLPESTSIAAEPGRETNCKTGFLYAIDLTRPEIDPLVFSPADGAINSVVFTPVDINSYDLAVGGDDGIIRIWQRDDTSGTYSQQNMLTGHDEEVRSLAFTPNSQTLVSGGHDGVLALWNLVEVDPVLQVLGSSTEWIRATVFSSSGNRLASTSGNGQIRIWEMSPEEPLAAPNVLWGHTAYVRALAYSPNLDKPMLVSAAEDGTIRIWSIRDGTLASDEVEIPYEDAQSKVSSLSFDEDGSRLAVASEDGGVFVIDFDAEKPEPRKIGEHANGILIVAMNPAGTVVAAGGRTGKVQLWDVTAATPTAIGESISEGGQIWAISFNHDGTLLAAGDNNGNIFRWNVPDQGQPVGSQSYLLQGVEIRSLVFGPKNELATGGSNGEICYWGNSEPDKFDQCPETLTGHNGDVRSLAFNGTGDLLASGGKDQSVRIWNTTDLDAAPIVIPTIAEWVRALAFSPDNKTLAAASTQGTIRLILAPIPDLVSLACDHVTRTLTEEERDQYGLTDTGEDVCAEPTPNDS